jgi:hypothetical protein
MEFAPCDLPAGLGQHRVPFERSGAPFAGEVDSRSGIAVRCSTVESRYIQPTTLKRWHKHRLG